MELKDNYKVQVNKHETPFMLTDLNVITNNFNVFREGIENVSVYYAVKSNNDPEVLKHLDKIGSNFDVASLNEINLLIDLGVNPAKMSFSPPVKKEGHIAVAYNLGVRLFVFDSHEELHKFSRVAPDAELVLRVLVNSEGSQCPMFKKFGVYIDEAKDYFETAKELNLNVVGLTFHVGSQCLVLDSWSQAIDRARVVWDEAARQGMEMNLINLGGGFPAEYSKKIVRMEDTFGAIREGLKKNFMTVTRVFVEPGRFMTNDASVTVASVIGKSKKGQTEWIYLDVGVFNGLFEVLEDFEYSVVTEKDSAKKVRYVVAGPSCDGLDIIRREVELPELNVGDKVYIMNTGAYSISKEHYNGLDYPRSYQV